MTMIHKITVILLAVFIAGIPGSAFSLTEENDPALITSVSISGLKRTKLQVVEKALHRFIGKEVVPLYPDLKNPLADQVKACIMDTGILEPVTVDILDDLYGEGKILAVEALLNRNKQLSDEEILFAFSGVRCRCTDPIELVRGFRAIARHRRRRLYGRST